MGQRDKWADRHQGSNTKPPTDRYNEKINVFHILESPSVASDMIACSHTPVDHDMERVTHECKTAKRLIESNRFSNSSSINGCTS